MTTRAHTVPKLRPFVTSCQASTTSTYTTFRAADRRTRLSCRSLGATVMVYSSSARINMIFNVDPAMPGTYWTVFKMTVAESGNITIIPINNYGYSVGAV